MKYLILLLVLFVVGCSNPSNPLKKEPKFKAGDCIQDINDLEFKELYEPHVRRILAVGKSNYKYAFYQIHREAQIFSIDDYYEKIDNAVCEARGM